MKKKGLLLILFILIIPFNVFALDGYYDEISVELQFENDVDYDSIEEICIGIMDSENKYELPLTKEDNFSKVITDTLYKLGKLTVTVGSFSDDIHFETKVYYQNTKAKIIVIVKNGAPVYDYMTTTTKVVNNNPENDQNSDDNISTNILIYIYIGLGIAVLIFLIFTIIKASRVDR